MNIISKYLFLFLCVVSFVVHAQDENQPPRNVCVNNPEIVFGFFNGVLTDKKEAIAKTEKYFL